MSDLDIALVIACIIIVFAAFRIGYFAGVADGKMAATERDKSDER
jgi:hypothetical protein